MPLAQGQILQNRYRIVRMLGQGSMAAVYLAQDMQQGGRWVAIKEMIPDPNAGAHALAQARTQFRREAQVLMSLQHHNLPQVYTNFAEGGNEYLVMQYIEGRNLLDIAAADWQQGRTLGEGRVLGWAIQIIDALEYLHGQRPYPVLHRDVKPQNIILTPGGELYLVDFGLVKLLDPNNPQTMTALRGLGTPEYAPPEQYASGGAHTGPYSDVYALGATLYHLLTGQPPSTATERLLPAPMTRPVVPPRQLNPVISPPVEQALVKALELAPAGRFTSVAEMRRALLGQGVVGLTTPLPTRRVVPMGWAIGIGAISLLVITVLILAAVLGGGGGIAAVTPTHTAIARVTPTLAPPTATPVPPTDTPTPMPLTPTPVYYVVPTPTLGPPPSTPTPIPTPTPVPEATGGAAAPAVTDIMIEIPAGPFKMGNDAGADDEAPAHEVDLPAFEVDKFEVTNADFAKFVEATGYQTEAEKAGEVGWRACAEGKDNHPVVKVTWNDANAYCEWAGKRLPTEAEWEKAARGPEGFLFPWGNEWDATKANVKESGLRGTAAVGSYPPNGYGLCDMAGNVWEWTADWYQPYPGSSFESPYFGEKYRVLRGGGWFETAEFVRTTTRTATSDTTANDDLGFRCAR